MTGRAATSLFLSPEIDDHDIIHDRSQLGAKRLVGGMRQVFGPVLLALEGQEKAMGQALVQMFRAVVGAPFKALNLRYLSLQIAKRVHDFLDLGRGGGVLEFKADDVMKNLLFGRIGGVHGEGEGGGRQHDGAEDEQSLLHKMV